MQNLVSLVKSFIQNETDRVCSKVAEAARQSVGNSISHWLEAVSRRPKEAHILIMGETLDSDMPSAQRRSPFCDTEFDDIIDGYRAKRVERRIPFIHGEVATGNPGETITVRVLPQTLLRSGALIVCWGAVITSVHLGNKSQDITGGTSTRVARTLDPSNLGQQLTIQLKF